MNTNALKCILNLHNQLSKYSYGVPSLPDDFTDEDYYNNWKLQSPVEFEKSKMGTCWDFTIYQSAKLHSMRIPHKNYYVILPKTKNEETHTFTVAKCDDKFIYLETAFELIAGVYETDKLDDIFNFVTSAMIENSNERHKDFYEIHEFDSYDKYGVNCETFMSDMRKTRIVKRGIYHGPGKTKYDIRTIQESVNSDSKDPLNKITEIYDKLIKFDYGKPEGPKNYKTRSVKEFEKKKNGICWDYANYLEWYLKQYYKDIQLYYYVMEKAPNYETHTFPIVKVDDKYYLVETSWREHAGIYESDSRDDILSQMYRWMREKEHAKPNEVLWTYKYNSNDELTGMTGLEFTTHMMDHAKEIKVPEHGKSIKRIHGHRLTTESVRLQSLESIKSEIQKICKTEFL